MCGCATNLLIFLQVKNKPWLPWVYSWDRPHRKKFVFEDDLVPFYLFNYIRFKAWMAYFPRSSLHPFFRLGLWRLLPGEICLILQHSNRPWGWGPHHRIGSCEGEGGIAGLKGGGGHTSGSADPAQGVHAYIHTNVIYAYMHPSKIAYRHVC